MTAFFSQCKWELLRQIRNRRFFFFSVLLPVGFYFLFVRLNGRNLEMEGTTWNAYYMMSMATFGIVGGALNGLSSRVAFERTQGWLRLVQTTPLSNASYFASKVVGQLMINAIQVVILFLAGALGEHVRMSAAHWILSGFWLSVGALPFIALGILLGLLAGAEAAQIIASGLYFIVSIAGGLWFPVTIMPSVMQHIAQWMPTYRLAHIAWQLLANRSVPTSDISVLVAYLAVFTFIALRFLRRQEEQPA